MKHVILTGFMGAGKTTVGELLARRLGCAFFDTDRLIEEEAGMSVSQIFETQGEEAFRGLETAILKKPWTQQEDWVLSVGGGLPMREENRKLLKSIGRVAYLRVRRDTVLQRLAGDVKGRVDSLLKVRGPLYENGADLVVDVDEKTPDAIVTELKKWLKLADI